MNEKKSNEKEINIGLALFLGGIIGFMIGYIAGSGSLF